MGYKHSKQEIIEKGSRIIQSRGYHNTGISEILKETGIPKGSFYNFFDTKENFCLEVIDYYGENGYKMMQDIFSRANLSPLEKLKAYYYEFMLKANKENTSRMGCLINNLSYELGAINDRLAKELDRQYKKQIKAISKVISDAQECNEVRRDHKAAELALFIHNNTIGGMGRMKITKSIDPLRKAIDMSFEYLTEKKS